MTNPNLSVIMLTVQHAGVAQWHSSWFVISRLLVRLRSLAPGGIPERPKGADCKSVVTDFAGPNPASPTKRQYRVLVTRYCFFLLLAEAGPVSSTALPCRCAAYRRHILTLRHSALAVSCLLGALLFKSSTPPTKYILTSFRAAIPSFPHKKDCNFETKLQSFFIQTAGLVYHHALACISSAFWAVYHHASACIFLRFDEIQHYVLMICNFLRNWWYTRLSPWFWLDFVL